MFYRDLQQKRKQNGSYSSNKLVYPIIDLLGEVALGNIFNIVERRFKNK